MSPTPRTPARKSTHSRKPRSTAATRHIPIAFESFAEMTSGAILIIQNRRILYANPAAARSTGYSHEELLKMELWQLAHPNYQPALKLLEESHARVDHVLSRFEIKIVTKVGEERWLDVTVGAIDYQGKTAIAVTAFDITERDQAERALRRAQADLEARVQVRTTELAAANEKLNSVLSAITEAYLAFDADWRFVAINPVAERNIFGRPAAELIGKIIWDEYPQTVGHEVYRQYHLAVETGRSVHFETPSRIVPGSWFEVHAYPRSGGLEAYFRDISERKRAEEEIASLARFPGENPNPVIRLSQTGEVLYANESGQMLLRAWASTTGDSALAYWRNLAAEVTIARVNQPVDFECNERAYSFFVVPILEAGYVNFYGRDITVRRQAEEALRESEERYRLLFDNSLDGILLTTPDGGIQAANAAACRMFGRTEQEICQIGRNGIVDVSDPHVAAAVAERARTGKFHSEMFLVRSDGTRFLGDVSSIMFRGKDGRLRTSMIVRDVTERRQAEEALRASEEKYRRLIENIDDLVCEVDAQAQYQFVNAQYEQILGYAPDELLGHYVREFIHPDDLQLSTPSFKKLVEGGSTSRNEWRFKHKNGEWRWFDCIAQTYEKSPGEQHVVVISRDVTERKEKESELAKLNRALRALSDSNQAMMRAENEAEYLAEVCKIVVKDCGHPMVWIGFAEQDEGKTVRPVAHAGFEEGYLETLKITWADTERGRGPTGTAIRTGKPSGCANMLTDPNFYPWRAEAVKRGYASSIVLPLIANDRAFGAINIYAKIPEAFSEEEIKLLTELASDLAYGITMLRLRVAHAQAEEALRLSEERFRVIASSTPDHLLVQDRDLRYSLVINPQLGLTEKDMLGKTDHEFLAKEDADKLTQVKRQVLDSGAPVHLETSLISQHGELEFFDGFYVPKFDAQNQVDGLIGYFRNITERKHMEEALRQARDELEIRVQERTEELETMNQELRTEIEERKLVENQLRLQMTAVRAAANGIVITDREGRIQWCNPAFTRITGYGAEEVAGQTLRILHSGQQTTDFYERLWATILAGEIWRGELTNRRKDGRLYVEEQTIAPVLNEQHEITHFVAVKQDITERKQAEDRLERYNQDLLALSKAERDQRQLAETLTAANLALTQSLSLETVLETLLDYIARLVPYDSANVMLLEAESRLAVRVTRGYERWSNVELVSAITFDVQTAPVLNTLLTTRRSYLVPDTRLEPSWQTPPGVEHVRSWLGVPLLAGGNVIGLYSLDKTEPGFFTTEHVRMAEMLVGQAAVAIQNAWLFEQVRAGRERLQSLSRRLVEVQEAERHYVARELHDEAGQALTSLLFRLGQIEQQTTDPQLLDQVAELKQMTNGVLESLHRLAMDLRPASLDHLGLMPALLQYVKAMGDRYGVIAQFKALGFEGERLPTDVETALYRIVQEALTNIVRHAHAKRADVLLERRGDRVIVVIEDDGIGFDADVARFAQQGHLGLVGMQERAEMLRGSLVIESIPGAGTTVVVEVPYDRSHFDR
jgi:PAS domain S-box-containing protein